MNNNNNHNKTRSSTSTLLTFAENRSNVDEVEENGCIQLSTRNGWEWMMMSWEEDRTASDDWKRNSSSRSSVSGSDILVRTSRVAISSQLQWTSVLRKAASEALSASHWQRLITCMPLLKVHLTQKECVEDELSWLCWRQTSCLADDYHYHKCEYESSAAVTTSATFFAQAKDRRQSGDRWLWDTSAKSRWVS